MVAGEVSRKVIALTAQYLLGAVTALAAIYNGFAVYDAYREQKPWNLFGSATTALLLAYFAFFRSN
jgi:drug/metabolite transporter superfamily protein YnfA